MGQTYKYMLRKKLLVLPILFLTLTNTPIVVGTESVATNPAPTQVIEPKEMDQRAKILSGYFAKYNSPFEYHAQDFIDAADYFGVDWMLVPSISGVESTFGKRTYGYNAWGWGIYGDNRLNFSSWRNGIFTVTGGLKENYINKGLTDPYSMNKKYASSKSWGWKVDFFMKDLAKFANQYEAYKADASPLRTTNPLLKTVGTSAQVSY